MPSRRPDAVKNLSGTARADRKPKREMGARLTAPPRPPPHLSDRARAEWKRLAPAVVGIGTLTSADLRAFELLAETLATASDAAETLARDGITSRTADGGLKTHPAVKVLETARSQAKALLGEFGLTPRARQGVDVKPPPAEPSVWDEFFPEANPWDRLRALQGGKR